MSFHSGITITQSNDANPVFIWSVGSDNQFADTGNYKYMATVRAHPNRSRIPTYDIVYRESGITSPRWEFSLTKNIASSGGPYRDYQVVIEAYNIQGKTSAGNQIGAVETRSWNLYSDGYDLIEISNPRQSGIEFSDNVPTQRSLGAGFSGITGNYASRQYIGPNGDVSIEFTSGAFDSDLAGGYLYISSGRFPKTETAARSGEWATAVKRVRFDFDPLNPYFIHPNAASEIRGATFGYGSVSFYDEIDKILIESGVNISSGLYMSNNAIFYANSTVSKLSLGAAELFTVRIPGVWTSIDTEVIDAIPSNGSFISLSTDAGGGGFTSIFYMGPPLTGSPFTGIYGGVGGGCPP
jgi:hypothetical protein